MNTREELKHRYVEAVGRWDESLEGLLDLDADFFAAYVGFAAAPWHDGGHLEPKVKELVLLAVDAAATHLHEPGHPPSYPPRSRASGRPRRSC